MVEQTSLFNKATFSLLGKHHLVPFLESSTKVIYQAESGEVREMNTVLPEQAALAWKGIWSTWLPETQSYSLESGHKVFVSTYR